MDSTVPEEMAQVETALKPRMSTGQQVGLSLFWFATSAQWTAILI